MIWIRNLKELTPDYDGIYKNYDYPSTSALRIAASLGLDSFSLIDNLLLGLEALGTEIV